MYPDKGSSITIDDIVHSWSDGPLISDLLSSKTCSDFTKKNKEHLNFSAFCELFIGIFGLIFRCRLKHCNLAEYYL